MTLRIGEHVEMTVTAVMGYGIHGIDAAGNKILVVIPEVSWIAAFDSCEQVADVGDLITVEILHVDMSTGKIRASIKQRFSDPWANGDLVQGHRYCARVIRFARRADRCEGEAAYLLEIVPGGLAMLCGTEQSLTPGQECLVVLRNVNPVSRSVVVELVQ